MTEANTQAVVQDAPVPAQPGATAQDAPKDDLASLLSEFEKEAEPKPQPQPVPQKTAAQPDPVSEQITALVAREELRDINDAVKAVRGEHEHVSERLVKGWLNAAAEEDPRLKSVFANRFKEPAKWEKALGALKREFAKEQSKLPDREVTEDVAAVAAAVRGASHKAPPETPPNYGAMSQSEFEKEKAKYL